MSMVEHRALETFEPEWAVPPGDTIAAILSARCLSREAFAELIGETIETVQRLLLGTESVDFELADRISRCLGSSRSFWMAREAQFQAALKRIRRGKEVRERVEWVKQFPTKEMEQLGWIGECRSPADSADECLRFFGVADVATWQSKYAGLMDLAAFRISSSVQKSPGAITAWLRWAELIAERTPSGVWDSEAFRARLSAIKRLTWQKDPAKFLPRLREVCAEVGVAVVVSKAPKGCPASGATRFLSPSKVMMVLSFRYRTDDQFWFTFFHEAAHLLLHGPDATFLEDESEVTGDEEREANEFAEATVVPPEHSAEFRSLLLDKDAILRFARRIGVAPGLVVGQLQHSGRIQHDQMNWMKRRYQWDQIGSAQLIP